MNELIKLSKEFQLERKHDHIFLMFSADRDVKYPLSYTVNECLEEYCDANNFVFVEITIYNKHQLGFFGRFHYKSEAPWKRIGHSFNQLGLSIEEIQAVTRSLSRVANTINISREVL